MIGPNSPYTLEALAGSRRQELLAEAAAERLLRAARAASRPAAARRERLGSIAVGIAAISLWWNRGCCPMAA